MAKRGRKKRAGKREPNGRLQRTAMTHDRGTDHAQAMQALYGNDGCDAIGRAYRAGLIGDGQDAKALLDTARRIAKAYWAAYGHGQFRSPLADRTGGGGTENAEAVRKREEWLNECLTTANRMGHRRNFDQLVIDVNPDHGPDWLDRLCYASRTKAMLYEPADTSAMERALIVLAAIAGVEKPSVRRLKAA